MWKWIRIGGYRESLLFVNNINIHHAKICWTLYKMSVAAPQSLGWLPTWVQDLRIPVTKWRNAQRLFSKLELLKRKLKGGLLVLFIKVSQSEGLDMDMESFLNTPWESSITWANRRRLLSQTERNSLGEGALFWPPLYTISHALFSYTFYCNRLIAEFSLLSHGVLTASIIKGIYIL